MVKEKASLADTAKSNLQDEFGSLRAELESYRHESKKRLYDVTTFYNESTARFAHREKGLVQYYVQKKQLPSGINDLSIENTTCDCRLSDLQYD